MLKAEYIHHPLHFHRPAGTSRGTLSSKDCWFVKLSDEEGRTGVGEVSYIPGLSTVDPQELEIRLDHVCKLISRGEMDPAQPLPFLPGIAFALETALKDLETGGRRILFPSEFTEGSRGIVTNGLIWMGSENYILEQVRKKMDLGFRVLKMKVGALDFEQESGILKRIRRELAGHDLEIRLDANGAWTPEEAGEKMTKLVPFGIHSIEQPIAPGHPEAMAALCEDSPIPIALDEELIGVHSSVERRKLLETIRPHIIILKPGLLGGFAATEDWISMSRELKLSCWITSALESNIGLSAIAQWTFTRVDPYPQGLGTGQLYRNNIPSPLIMKGDQLWYRRTRSWELEALDL
jgi:O-succinylbenzoate synthase